MIKPLYLSHIERGFEVINSTNEHYATNPVLDVQVGPSCFRQGLHCSNAVAATGPVKRSVAILVAVAEGKVVIMSVTARGVLYVYYNLLNAFFRTCLSCPHSSYSD